MHCEGKSVAIEKAYKYVHRKICECGSWNFKTAYESSLNASSLGRYLPNDSLQGVPAWAHVGYESLVDDDSTNASSKDAYYCSTNSKNECSMKAKNESSLGRCLLNDFRQGVPSWGHVGDESLANDGSTNGSCLTF